MQRILKARNFIAISPTRNQVGTLPACAPAYTHMLLLVERKSELVCLLMCFNQQNCRWRGRRRWRTSPWSWSHAPASTR